MLGSEFRSVYSKERKNRQEMRRLEGGSKQQEYIEVV